jgi:hypothetical protein
MADNPDVHYVGHVNAADHNAFNCTPRTVLNISREHGPSASRRRPVCLRRRVPALA